jgi:UDP-glucuronate decarboxylase
VQDDHLGPFNIGNPGEFTMVELANLVKEVINPQAEVSSTSCLRLIAYRPCLPACLRACVPSCPQSAPRGQSHPPPLQIIHVENTSDDPSRRKPDITKARTTLGWEPKVPLREGLQLMVDDFRK